MGAGAREVRGAGRGARMKVKVEGEGARGIPLALPVNFCCALSCRRTWPRRGCHSNDPLRLQLLRVSGGLKSHFDVDGLGRGLLYLGDIARKERKAPPPAPPLKRRGEVSGRSQNSRNAARARDGEMNGVWGPWPQNLNLNLFLVYKGFPSLSRYISRRPTWFAGPTKPSVSIRSIHFAAVL